MPLTTAVSPGPPLGRGQGISFTKCPVPSPLTPAPHPPTPPPTMHTFSVEGPGLLSASVTFLSTSHPSSPDQSWQDISCSWVFLLKRDVGPTVSSDRTPFWSLRSLACMGVKSLLSCLTLCDPMDCSPPGSSVHGILHARILEWVARPFSRGSSRPSDGTSISCIGRQILYHWATRKG